MANFLSGLQGLLGGSSSKSNTSQQSATESTQTSTGKNVSDISTTTTQLPQEVIDLLVGKMISGGGTDKVAAAADKLTAQVDASVPQIQAKSDAIIAAAQQAQNQKNQQALTELASRAGSSFNTNVQQGLARTAMEGEVALASQKAQQDLAINQFIAGQLQAALSGQSDVAQLNNQTVAALGNLLKGAVSSTTGKTTETTESLGKTTGTTTGQSTTTSSAVKSWADIIAGLGGAFMPGGNKSTPTGKA